MAGVTIRFIPADLIQRFERYPQKLDEEMERATKAALAHVQGSVPPYPPAPPNSSYVRTGTLGRSIGLGGQAEIYTVEKMGGGWQAQLGTRLEYAPTVIGESQGPAFSGRWWKLSDALNKARPGIERIYAAMARRLVDWLD